MNRVWFLFLGCFLGSEEIDKCGIMCCMIKICIEYFENIEMM